MKGISENLKWPIKVLEQMGLFKQNHEHRKHIAVALAYIGIAAFNVCMQLLQFLNYNGDIFVFVNISEAVAAFSYLAGLLTTFIHNIKGFEEITKLTPRFWKTDKCPEKIQMELNSILKYNRLFQILFFVINGATTIAFVTSPLFGRDLPIGAWTLTGYRGLHIFVLALQTIMLPILVYFLFAYQMIFMTSCIELVVQFRILGHLFEHLDVSSISEGTQLKYYQKLKNYIRHHIFLLRFIKLLQRTYSKGLACAYVMLMCISCIQMYAAVESDNLAGKLQHIQGSLSVLAELSMYFIPADYVTHEAMQVGYAMYASNWSCQYFPDLQKSIPFIIQRSYHKLAFSAEGLFEINCRALITVLKLSWSACTVMRGLKNSH